MRIEIETKCNGCRTRLNHGDYAHTVKLGEEDSFLCVVCWRKCERGGRSPQQVMEAILLMNDDNFDGGPDDPCDHEDYRDLELLGLWPELK